MSRKRRSISQIKEDSSFPVFREVLPAAWVIHQYAPDYGIDYAVELFDFLENDPLMAETLGESFYVQLKSSTCVEYAKKRVFSRQNIERTPPTKKRTDFVDIEVAKFQLETSELATVQAMGSAVPVLLFLVDLTAKRIFFVCLNDYIDKVMIPEDPEYAVKKSKVIDIPLANELTRIPQSCIPLRVFGKRAKMYAAFAKFAYQKNEIDHVLDKAGAVSVSSFQEEIEMLRLFVEAALRLDIWQKHDFWPIVDHYRRELESIGQEISSGIAQEETVGFLKRCRLLWQGLSVLSNNYEENVREQFLPTYFAELLAGRA